MFDKVGMLVLLTSCWAQRHGVEQQCGAAMVKGVNSGGNSLLSKPAELGQFLKASREELNKVSKPTRQDTVQFTLLTLVLMVIVAASLSIMDFVFIQLRTVLLGG